MPKTGLVLLVLVLLGGAYWLGTRQAAAPAAVAQPAAPVDPEAGARAEREASARPESQPRRTFIGPDGRAWLIGYDPDQPPDNKDRAAVSEGLLADMRNHSRAISERYDIPLADVQAMAAGAKPLPESLLPPPRDAAAAPADAAR